MSQNRAFSRIIRLLGLNALFGAMGGSLTATLAALMLIPARSHDDQRNAGRLVPIPVRVRAQYKRRP